jgi:hypothetical protein
MSLLSPPADWFLFVAFLLIPFVAYTKKFFLGPVAVIFEGLCLSLIGMRMIRDSNQLFIIVMGIIICCVSITILIFSVRVLINMDTLKEIKYQCSSCDYEESKFFPPTTLPPATIPCPKCNHITFHIHNPSYLERMKQNDNSI